MKHLVEKLEKRLVVGKLTCNKCGEEINGRQYTEECTTFLVQRGNLDAQVDLCKYCTEEILDVLLIFPQWEE
jgi:hypothetical protein